MMVKRLDDNSIDHIGFALWQAAADWKSRMRGEMARRGFPWHLGARGEVLAFLGPKGISQLELTEKMGLSKQAVQQLLDLLEADGVLRRVPDPADKRARRIELTELGLRDYAERAIVKQEIEESYRQKLGKKLFGKLVKALDQLRETA